MRYVVNCPSIRQLFDYYYLLLLLFLSLSCVILSLSMSVKVVMIIIASIVAQCARSPSSTSSQSYHPSGVLGTTLGKTSFL